MTLVIQKSSDELGADINILNNSFNQEFHKKNNCNNFKSAIFSNFAIISYWKNKASLELPTW